MSCTRSPHEFFQNLTRNLYMFNFIVVCIWIDSIDQGRASSKPIIKRMIQVHQIVYFCINVKPRFFNRYMNCGMIKMIKVSFIQTCLVCFLYFFQTVAHKCTLILMQKRRWLISEPLIKVPNFNLELSLNRLLVSVFTSQSKITIMD